MPDSPTADLRLYKGTLNAAERALEGPGVSVRLSPTEAALLACLAALPGEVFSKERLLREVWGYRPGVKSRTVFSTIARLRQKIELDPAEPRHVLTVDGGYCFALREDEPVAVDGHFIGRLDALERLEGLLDARAPLITVFGPGGTGKTALAAAFAERAARGQVRERIWVELEGVDSSEQARRAAARALGLPAGSPAAQLRRALGARAGAGGAGRLRRAGR